MKPLFFLISLLIVCSCKNNKFFNNRYYFDKKIECMVSKSMSNFVTKPIYSKVYNQFLITLDTWIYIEKLYHYSSYPIYNNYKVDSTIFITKDKSQALMFITLKLKDTIDLKLGKSKRGGDAQLIYARIQPNNTWRFIEKGFVSVAFEVTDSLALTHKQLQERTLSFLKEKKIISLKTCDLNEKVFKESFRSYK